MTNTREIPTSANRRQWVGRVDAGMRVGFLVVAAYALLRSGLLAQLWEYFGG